MECGLSRVSLSTRSRTFDDNLCTAVGIVFDEAMLSWPPGRRDSDGIWGEHWYGAVEASNGFAPPPAAPPEVPAELAAVVAAAQPIYEEMRQCRLQ